MPRPKPRGSDPQVRAAFDKMHELYCRSKAETSVCQLYFARKSGESRPALPEAPPAKADLDDMHRVFCAIKAYAKSYPCARWKARQQQP